MINFNPEMKKHLFWGIPAMALFLGACNSDPGKSVTQVTYPVYSLVTDRATASTQPVASAYNYTFNFTQENVKIAAALSYDGTTRTFTSNETTYTSDTYSGGMVIKLGDIEAYWDNNTTRPIGNFRCELTSLINTYTTDVPGVPALTEDQKSTLSYPASLVSYSVGTDLLVSSFPIIAWYKGETTTSYPTGNGDGSYSDKNMVYRVGIDVPKKTACVVIYEPRFAEVMPSLPAIVLENLPVVFENGTYTIRVKDVVPKVAEGNGLTEYPNYIFNEFEFIPMGMANALISYKVAGRFEGHFSGSWLQKYGDE